MALPENHVIHHTLPPALPQPYLPSQSRQMTLPSSHRGTFGSTSHRGTFGSTSQQRPSTSQQHAQPVHASAPFTTGKTPGPPKAGPYAPGGGYPFGSSEGMPPGGWASTPRRSAYDPDNPPFSGLRTDPAQLSELGIMKETCLELAYHTALQFAMIYITQTSNTTFDDATEKAFVDSVKNLNYMVQWFHQNGGTVDGNLEITPDIRRRLDIAFRWVYMYTHDNQIAAEASAAGLPHPPGYGMDELIRVAKAALANSPHSKHVLTTHITTLPFYFALVDEFAELKDAIDRKNLEMEFAPGAEAFRARGGRGLRHKLRRHYKLTRRHKPKRHYKLTRRHKLRRHYKLTRRHKPKHHYKLTRTRKSSQTMRTR